MLTLVFTFHFSENKLNSLPRTIGNLSALVELNCNDNQAFDLVLAIPYRGCEHL